MKTQSATGETKTANAREVMPVEHETPDVIDLVPALLHLKKILVPFDFSQFSKKALQYALRFAEQFEADITVVHVVQRLMIDPDDVGLPAKVREPNLDRLPADKRQLEKMCAELSSAQRLGVTPLICQGAPAREIIETATKLNADLIVIATHGYTGLKHLCLGSTTERVVREAPCPVLVVREKEHEFI